MRMCPSNPTQDWPSWQSNWSASHTIKSFSSCTLYLLQCAKLWYPSEIRVLWKPNHHPDNSSGNMWCLPVSQSPPNCFGVTDRAQVYQLFSALLLSSVGGLSRDQLRVFFFRRSKSFGWVGHPMLACAEVFPVPKSPVRIKTLFMDKAWWNRLCFYDPSWQESPIFSTSSITLVSFSRVKRLFAFYLWCYVCDCDPSSY